MLMFLAIPQVEKIDINIEHQFFLGHGCLNSETTGTEFPMFGIRFR